MSTPAPIGTETVLKYAPDVMDWLVIAAGAVAFVVLVLELRRGRAAEE